MRRLSMVTGTLVIVEGMNSPSRLNVTDRIKTMLKQAGVVTNNFKSDGGTVENEIRQIISKLNDDTFIAGFDENEKHGVHLAILDMLLSRLYHTMVAYVTPALLKGEVVVLNTYIYNIIAVHGIDPIVMEYIMVMWEAKLYSLGDVFKGPDYVIYCKDNKHTKPMIKPRDGYEQWSNMLMESADDRYSSSLASYKAKQTILLDTGDFAKIDFSQVTHMVSRIISKRNNKK